MGKWDKNQKGVGTTGCSLGAISPGPSKKTNRKTAPPAETQPYKLLRKLVFLPQRGSYPGRKRAQAARPAPPPPWPRPHPAGHAQWAGPGQAGRFAWLLAVTGAGSPLRSRVPSARLVPGKLRAEHGFRGATGRATWTAGGPRCCRGASGRGRRGRAAKASGGRASGHTRREAPAGRAPWRRPGRAGVPWTFVRVESPPRGLGLSGLPRPPSPLAPGRCLSGLWREEPAGSGHSVSGSRSLARRRRETRCLPEPQPPR